MRVLFAVDSFFQLIEATNLKLTVYQNDDVDIALYASTPNAYIICENLKKRQVFERCYYIETPLTRCGAKYSFKEKLPKYFIYLYTLINPKDYVQRKLRISELYYDQFIFAGNGALPECIFNALKKTNPLLKCLRFEDSYVSYTKQYGKIKSTKRKVFEFIARKLFNGYEIENSIVGYYFNEPDLVQAKFNYPIITAPKIGRENHELINILNIAFKYHELQDTYHERYIFFESGDAYFENNNEDVAFIRKLAEIVGKDQILIKRHPRCIENRFETLGVHIAQTVSIPWELILLNISMKDKIFITTTSAAALSSEIYFGDSCKAILLFEAMKNKPNSVSQVMRNYMNAFQHKYGSERLYMPKSIAEFEQLVKEI